jgi:hypothetical protein
MNSGQVIFSSYGRPSCTHRKSQKARSPLPLRFSLEKSNNLVPVYTTKGEVQLPRIDMTWKDVKFKV